MRVADLVSRHARARPRDLALVCGSEQFTWTDLDERTDALAAVLASASVPGGRVAIATANCHRHLEAIFAASKAALNSMTMSLARAFAPEVRVNAIAPGVILTRWVDGKTAFIDAYVEKAPLQKASTPEDIAHMAVFLAEAHNVTGQTLVIDGGFMLG